jgi:hypothetical protein
VAGSPSLIGPVLPGETPTEPKHAVLELAALLDAEVSMTKIILQALEARIVGLKKLVWVGRLLVVVGWVGALDSTVSTVGILSLWAGRGAGHRTSQ